MDGTINSTDYEIESCKDGNKTIKIKTGDKYKYLHSKYAPVDEANRFIETITTYKKNYYVCFGFGFGYYVRALLAKLHKEDVLIVVEPYPDIFRHARENVSVEDLLRDKRFSLIITRDGDVISKAIVEKIGIYAIDFIKVLLMPLYQELYPEECRSFLQAVKDEQLSLVYVGEAAANNAELWNRNFYKNFKYILESYDISHFFNLFQGRPAILVSAGPSLLKNIDLLKQVKHKVPIICVFTAYKVLEKHGIEPDFVISIDANQLIVETAQEKAKALETPLICVSLGDPKLMKKHVGKKLNAFISSEFPMIHLMKAIGREVTEITSYGSVACSALDFIFKAGADPIVFLGQDLAYTGDKSHAKGTSFDDPKFETIIHRELEVADVFGGKVFTSKVMYAFKVWFEQYIKEHEETLFIDATEGGALIAGTQVMGFKEVIETYCGGLEEDLEKLYEVQFQKGKLLAPHEIEKMLEIIIQTKNEFENSIPSVKEAIEACHKLTLIHKNESLTAKEEKLNAKLLSKLTKADNIINSLENSIALTYFLLTPVMVQFHNYVDKPGDSPKMSLVNKSLAFYTGLLHIFEANGKLIDETIKDIEDFLKITDDEGVKHG